MLPNLGVHEIQLCQPGLEAGTAEDIPFSGSGAVVSERQLVQMSREAAVCSSRIPPTCEEYVQKSMKTGELPKQAHRHSAGAFGCGYSQRNFSGPSNLLIIVKGGMH